MLLKVDVDVDIKPVISKDPPTKSHRGPGRPPKSKNAVASSSKSSTQIVRTAPYDRLQRPHHPPQRGMPQPTTIPSFRIPSNSRAAFHSGINSSPLANRSNSSASTLLRKAAHNALAAEEGAGGDGANNSQLLDALSKMSRALRLSSEA